MVVDMAKKIKEMGLEKSTLGLISKRTMPTYIYEGLLRELPEANFVEAGEILVACRLIKSPEEMKFVRMAAKSADMGFKAIANIAKPGITDYDLYAEYQAAIARWGAEQNSFVPTLYSKQWPDGMSGRGRERILQNGDVILTELAPCVDNYFAELCRPISLGKPSADFVENFNIHKEMYRMGRDLFRAGNVAEEIDDEVRKFALSKKPFVRASVSFQWPDFELFNARPIQEFKVGMVSVIHPNVGATEPDFMLGKGYSGHILGDTCIVTEGESETTSELPMEITII